jgi:hypothetical protein
MSIFAEAFESSSEPRGEVGPIKDGEYEARLADVSESDHPITGLTATNLEYEITSGDFKGRKVWDNVSHRDDTMWKVAKVWNAMGMKGMPDDWSGFTLGLTQNCTNKHFNITVKNREYNGKTYTNIVSVKADDEKPPF